MELVFRNKGIVYLTLCLDLTLYFVGPASERVDGILEFYEQSLEILKKDIVQYETGTMSRPRPVKSDTFSILPLWLKNPKAMQEMMMMRLDNSITADSAADKAFQFVYFDPFKAGALRLVLPIAFIGRTVSTFVDLAKSLAGKVGFSSGLGGYSLNWNRLGDFAHDAKKEIMVISRRYPGIDIPDLTGDVRVVGNGIKCVNWLTFLSSNYMSRLGGVEGLRSILDSETELRFVQDGLMIQAGPQPEIGDVNRHAALPFYHKVGHALRTLRAKDHFPFVPSESSDANTATQEWLARFDS